MPHFVYILQADDGRYYIGQSEDVERRIAQHLAGRVQSTKSRTGWKLVYREQFDTRIEAIKRERQIKKQKSRAYIERLIGTSPPHPIHRAKT
ncbi:MAG TPA: GIY-YIG nuclease family protein [Acidobacteriota bacterium]|nr:GIY-YIG nuclease family protein [Acidobacteriota bacterium]